MVENFGFSYVGAVYLALLFVPNLFWTRNQPKGYTPAGESRTLGVLERIGEVLVACTALIFSDFNLRPLSPWSLWLAASFACMLLYEVYWVRYFRSSKTLENFYSSLLGIPVAGATLPVMAFGLLGVYGKNAWMLLAAAILGCGHIGIHLEHRKKLSNIGKCM